MKIERQEGFSPVVITLQTPGEAAILKGLIGPSYGHQRKSLASEYANVEATDEDSRAFQTIYDTLDGLLPCP